MQALLRQPQRAERVAELVEIVDRLARVIDAAYAGTWLRQISHGADPRARPHFPGNNRWQRGDAIDALYLADNDETLWAEWYRHLAERGIPSLQQLPRDVWRYRVGTLDVADLTTPGRHARVGLVPPRLGRRGWPAYQEGGREALARGLAGTSGAERSAA